MRATSITGTSKEKNIYPTGMGLSLAYAIVQTHGEGLKAQTNEGGGSEFIIDLIIK